MGAPPSQPRSGFINSIPTNSPNRPPQTLPLAAPAAIRLTVCLICALPYDSAEHQARVLGLADRLRADGIDAEVDQYNAAPPPLWCEQQIEAADFVLMVCTEAYRRRVKGNEQPGTGQGVVWEAGIIRQLLYDAGALSDKFVPVLFSDGLVEHVPTLIRGRTRYVVDIEEGYERLLRQLSGQPSVVRPVLGSMCTRFPLAGVSGWQRSRRRFPPPRPRGGR